MAEVLVEFVVLSHTHTSVCVLGFSGALTNNKPPSESRVPSCIRGLSVVITDHLIIITTIKNKSVRTCDIQTAQVDDVMKDEDQLDNIWHFILFKKSHRGPTQLIVVFICLLVLLIMCVSESLCEIEHQIHTLTLSFIRKVWKSASTTGFKVI